MASGKRDFSEFNAKLEKHIERLPEYAERAQEKAQRAQEKLQRYFPPNQSGSAGGTGSLSGGAGPRKGDAPRAGGAAGPPVRSSPWSMGQSGSAGPMNGMRLPAQLATGVPVVAEAKAKWDRWNEPSARLERRKRRTSRALTLWIMLTILCGLFAVAGFTGLIGAQQGLEGAFGGIAGAVVCGTLGVRSGLRLRQLNRTELPVAAAPPPALPPSGSVAREPMQRLAEAESSLAELLAQLSAAGAGGTAAVPEISVADARSTADEAAGTLRGLADRIQAIERARNATPAGQRGSLDAGISTLREQLDDGLDGYGQLVAAAGRAVAASGGGGMRASREALTEATDHLAGLAMALRDLS